MSPDVNTTVNPVSELKVLAIVKQSLQTLWRHKSLWFFGFFVTGASASAGAPRAGTRTTAVAGALPSWAIWVILAGVLVALGSLVLHVLCEAALISEVRRASEGGAPTIGPGLRQAKPHFGRVLVLKAMVAAVYSLAAGVLATPALLAVGKVLPLAVGLGLSITLVLVGVPVLLSIYFLYVYALRIAVLEDVPAVEAVRRARVFLHGRVAISLELLVAWYLGAALVGAAVVVASIPAALIAGLCYLAAGKIAALLGGVALMIPAAMAAVGALGTYRSSVWTLGYLKARATV
jgi:hypothetical protein